MAISTREIHEKKIHANLSESDIKDIILRHVLKVSGVSESECKHSTSISSNHGSSGTTYSARCEITIDLGSKP